MKKAFKMVCMALALGFMTSCGTQSVSDKVYNQGINLTPAPVSLQQQEGKFALTSSAVFKINGTEAGQVAAFFANKLKSSTGFNLAISETEGNIAINVDPALEMNAEG
jgi:hexosaminidase